MRLLKNAPKNSKFASAVGRDVDRSGSREPFYKSREWFEARGRALARDKYCCVNCGASVKGPGLARVDHIKPLKERWDLRVTLSNLRTLCAKCDNARHSEKGSGGVEKVEIDPDGYPVTGVWASNGGRGE